MLVKIEEGRKEEYKVVPTLSDNELTRLLAKTEQTVRDAAQLVLE